VRRLDDNDWSDVADTFHAAFAQLPPLCSWNEHAAARASRVIINWARRGGDGLLTRDACFVASNEDGTIVGAAIVALVKASHLRPSVTLGAFPHPEDASQLVLPHLDWIFVAPMYQRGGVGNALLDAVVAALRRANRRVLASTCMIGHPASVTWHWRNGFQTGPSQCQDFMTDRE
jgi:GNAT superfamily N-acetyltransferase